MNSTSIRRWFITTIIAVTFGSVAGLALLQNQPPAVPGLVHRLSGHESEVYDVAFTPDSKYLITASFDNSLKMWDVETGKELRTFGGQGGHTKMVLCVDVSPDGRYMASGGLDNQMKIWDVPATSPLKSLKTIAGLSAVAVTPDGKRIAAAGSSGDIVIIDAENDKKLFELKGHKGKVRRLAFTTNGATLVSAGDDGTIRTWNATTGKAGFVHGAHLGTANDLALSPNNTTAFTVGQDGKLRFWQITAPGPRAFPEHKGKVLVMAVAPNESQVLTAGEDLKVRVSNYANAQSLRELKGADAKVSAATFNSNASAVAAGTVNGMLLFWNNSNGQLLGQAIAHEGPVTAVSIRPQNDQLLTAGADGLLRLWSLPLVAPESFTTPTEVLAAAVRSDGTKIYTGGKDKILRAFVIKTKQMERQFSGHTGAITAVAISPNGAYLASGAEDSTIRLWDQNNGKEIASIGGHTGKVTGLAFNAANSALASVGSDGTVKLWKLPLVPEKALAHADIVTCAVLTPDGSRLVTGCNDKQVRLWNLSNGSLERTFGGHTLPIADVAVSGNGQIVAAAGADKFASLWQLSNGQVIKKLKLPAPATAIAIGPAHAFVATADNTIRVFAIKDGKEIKVLKGHGGPITGLTFVPQGNLLVSASADKTVRIWDTAKGTQKASFTQAGPITSAAVSAKGDRIAVGVDKTAKVLNLNDGKELGAIKTAEPIRSLAFAPKGDRLLIGLGGKGAAVYTLGGAFVELFPHTGDPRVVLFHNDGKRIISAGTDKMAHVRTSALLWQQSAGAPIQRVVFSPKSDRVYTAGDDKSIAIWNAADGKSIAKVAAHGAAVIGLAVSGDGNRLVSAGIDKSVKLWDVSTPQAKLTGTITVPDVPTAIAFSPKGDQVGVAYGNDKERQLAVYDTASQLLLQRMPMGKAAVREAFYLPDGRTIVATGDDKAVTSLTVGVLAVIPAHKGGVTSVQFHSGGTQALTAGADKTVKVWDLAKRSPIRAIGPLPAVPAQAVYSRNFTAVAAVAGQQALLWNAANGQAIGKIALPDEALAVSFNSDGKRLLTGTKSGAYVWESTGKLLEYFPGGGPVGDVWFSNNNTNVVFNDGTTPQVATLAVQRVLDAAAKPLTAVGVYSNGAYVFTGGEEKDVKMWNAGNGNMERVFKGATETINAIAVAKNNLLVAIAAGKTVRVHRFADAKEIASVEAPGEVVSLGFTPNNQALVAACAPKTIVAWNAVIANVTQPPPDSFLKPVQSFEETQPIAQMVVGNDSATIYAAGKGNAVSVWKLAAPTPLASLAQPGIVDAVAFSPDGKILAAAGHAGKIRLYDVKSRKQLREINAHTKKNETMIYSIAFSPDSKLLATGSYDRSAKIFNVANGSLVREIAAYDEKKSKQGHKEPIFAVAFSPDGKYLATGSSGLERLIKIWNVSNGSLVRDLKNPEIKSKEPQSHPGWIYKLRFSPDGKYLVSSGDAPANHGYLAVWSVADGKLVSSRQLPLGAFYGLDISPNGQYVAVGAGVRGRPMPGLNTAYVFEFASLK